MRHLSSHPNTVPAGAKAPTFRKASFIYSLWFYPQLYWSDFWRYDRIIDLNYHQRQTAPFRFPAPFCAVMKPCASGPRRTFYGIWTGACRRRQTQTSRLSTGRTLSYELIMRIKRAPRKHKTGMKDKLQLHQKYSMFTHILLLWFTI